MMSIDKNKIAKYILITPAKDEERNLPAVAEAVIRQTILPATWIIVDDGSTDDTPEIIKQLENRYEWIKSVHLPSHPRDITFHLSYVQKIGFEYAIQFCEINNIHFDSIGLLDADTVIEESYFEQLIAQLDINPRLGIASGHITDRKNNEFDWDDIKNNNPDSAIPRGSGRLWRKECFIETGGYVIEPSPDSISSAKAILRGWDIAQFGHVRAVQLRETSSAEGLWNGYRIGGTTAYYFNKHPLIVLLNSFVYFTKQPHYIGLAYLHGYLLEWLKKSPKINDPEIQDYFRNKRIKEYFKSS